VRKKNANRTFGAWKRLDREFNLGYLSYLKAQSAARIDSGQLPIAGGDADWDQWTTVSDAAKMLGCSRQWVYKLITEGKIQALTVGDDNKVWLVRRDSLPSQTNLSKAIADSYKEPEERS